MNRRDAIKNTLLFTGVSAMSAIPVFADGETKRKKVIRKVAQLGHQCLRIKTKLISETNVKDNKYLKVLIEDMIETLNDSGGVGLASAQIYEEVSLFVFMNDNEKAQLEVVINPEILNASEEMEKGYEGCLSIPGIRALVPRHKWIEVAYINIDQKKIKRRYTDFIARIFQHEYDHLNGLVFLDRLESNRDIISEEEYQKLPK